MGLIVIIGLALIISLTVRSRAQLELRAVRRELREVSSANEDLRKALGDLTIVIAAKDREIERLAHLPCDDGKKAQPGSTMGPGRPVVANSSAADLGNNERDLSVKPCTDE